MQKINKTLSPLTGKGRGLRYAIIRKPLVCWMAESENLEVLSNSDEAEEARQMGLPALSWYQSQSYPTP